MKYLVVFLLAAAASAAQPDARDLVRQSIRNGEQAWRASFDYACTKHEVDKQFDSRGAVKATDSDLYHIIPLGYGSSFEMHVSHNREPVPREEMAKEEKELAHRRAESPQQKRLRFQKEANERSYMKEVADAFNFRILGTENLPTGPAWVVEAAPRPEYQPRTRYGRMFPAMRGKLWIDQKDVQWVKADAVSMDTVSFGFFIARLAKGSHIVIEQTKLPDGAWVPKRIMARASARTFVFFNHNFSEDITYSDYRRGPTTVAMR